MKISDRLEGKSLPKGEKPQREASRDLGEYATGSIAERLGGASVRPEDSQLADEEPYATRDELTFLEETDLGLGEYTPGTFSKVLEGAESTELNLENMTKQEAGKAVAEFLRRDFNAISNDTETLMYELRERLSRAEAASWQEVQPVKDHLVTVETSLKNQEEKFRLASDLLGRYVAEQQDTGEQLREVDSLLVLLERDLKEMTEKTRAAEAAVHPLVQSLDRLHASDRKDIHEVEGEHYDLEQDLRDRAITGVGAREKINRLRALTGEARKSWAF